MWFDTQSYIQTFGRDFDKMLRENGWEKDLAYRIKSGESKYIEVKLYQSLGSDTEIRKFGTAIAYDTANPPFADNRIVPNNSPLGALGIADGTKTEFQLEVFPVVPSSVGLFADGVEIKTGFTVNAETGKVVFSAAPESGKRLSSTYQLADDAHEPNNEMYIFSYNSYSLIKEVTRSDAQGDLGKGDGTKTVFPLPATNVEPDTIKVWRSGTEATEGWTYDAEQNAIVFTEPVTINWPVTASYTINFVPDENKELEEMIAAGTLALEVDTASDVMDKVYSSILFNSASLPTAVSFTPDTAYTSEWQRDSTVYMYGNINKDRIIMFMRVDPSANPVEAYFVPLYIGKLQTIGNKPRRNMLIFSGARDKGTIDWKAGLKLGNSPLDYGADTANGNNVAQLAQSYSGGMYQNHYFAFITHDKEVDNGQGRYNPSMYSNKYHLSQIFIVHPNEGYVGKLDDIYAVHPKNIQQADELEIVKSVENEEVGVGDGEERFFHLDHKPKDGTLVIEVNCVEVPSTDYTFDKDTKQLFFNTAPVGEILAKYDFAQLYRYTLPTTPISPCTQDKATPFNPIGLALYKEELE